MKYESDSYAFQSPPVTIRRLEPPAAPDWLRRKTAEQSGSRPRSSCSLPKVPACDTMPGHSDFTEADEAALRCANEAAFAKQDADKPAAANLSAAVAANAVADTDTGSGTAANTAVSTAPDATASAVSGTAVNANAKPVSPSKGPRRQTLRLRLAGLFTFLFDFTYLAAVFAAVLLLLATGVPSLARSTAALMALVLAGGDCFHLIPRMLSALSGERERFEKAIGFGRFVTSITVTVFYLLLWRLFLAVYPLAFLGLPSALPALLGTVLYLLAAVRILLCLLPQNRWSESAAPEDWLLRRSVPLIAMGVLLALLFFLNRAQVHALQWMWFAILLGFLFYIPFILHSHKLPALRVLMLPNKLCSLWMLWMCLQL